MCPCAKVHMTMLLRSSSLLLQQWPTSCSSYLNGLWDGRQIAVQLLFSWVLFSGFDWIIGQLGKVFANCSRDRGSIPDRVIPKTLKMVLDASLLNTQHYKVCIKGSGAIQGRGEAPSPTHQRCSYWKGNIRVAPWLWLPTLLTFRIHSRQHIVFLCSSPLVFSLCILILSWVGCIHIIV